jgi:hypothetical protein
VSKPHSSGVHKLKRGPPKGSHNARKGVALPDDLRLDSADGVLRLMREIVIPYTLSGEIGTRQSSAVTSAAKILLDYSSLEEMEARVSRLENEKGAKGN